MATEQVIYPDELQATLVRVKAEHGPDVVNATVINWLKDRQRLHGEIDAKDLKARFDGLSRTEKEEIPLPIRIKLGIEGGK